MKSKYFLLNIVFFLFYILSCNTTEPPPPPDGEKPTLELTLEDVSCIEAWINLTTTNLQLPATITLKQYNPSGDSLSQDFILNTQDTLLYVDSLIPNQTYSFQSFIHSINQSEVKSNELSVTTMDTTSHNFTWQTFEFVGIAGSCTFYDVAIINENYIIAVGNVFLTDSIGQPDPQAYGVAIWNGQIWELRKLFYNTNIPVTPRGIYVISPTEIYLASGSIFKWDGSSSNVQLVFSRLNLPDPNATIEKLWGSSNSSIYGVGNVGSIVFYNGTGWQRIESGTNLNIGDIWGISDGNGGYNKYLAADNAMLKLNKDNDLYRIDSQSGMFVHSVWGISNRLIYSAGEGVVLYKNYNWEKIDRIDVNTTYVIRGRNYNDVYGISSIGTILHFNGFSWGSINVPPENIFLRLDVKENVIASVGWQGEKAAITVIRRNN
jgi:hypothetical protein